MCLYKIARESNFAASNNRAMDNKSHFSHTVKFALVLAMMMSWVGVSARLNGSYYGTNYTVPFAHAYRALERLGVDHRQSIDRDVYHMARLGLNGYRLHLWDVELCDGEGNLLENEHLDLLDYLIASLERRGISIVLTAQTNFGNGYPERNTNPNDAYSYKYEKCRVHDDLVAQDAQERYLRALVAHVNPYTGKSYAADRSILALEINNEPCHSGSHDEITAYVNRMASAIRQAGWDKEVLYNVSHNLWRTSAFYRADIDGTTFQWYPSGLVHGSQRKGNFLPALDQYEIPFDTVPGYAEQAKYIYEYDPADVLDTYLYPAAARTFRKEGFVWATQFAYDPIDMARFNTEYQTHFLNLAYTPGKAIGMAIASEVMQRTAVGEDFGKYPVDTIFGDFLVSARRNLAMLNDGVSYYHTNSTADAPKNYKKLAHIAAVGSSPVVTTDGTGAYFIDRLASDVWRLEVMPDVVLTTDPFARPSLDREVGRIIDAPVAMTLDLPGLSDGFAYQGSRGVGVAAGKSVSLMPGVYLLGTAKSFGKWTADKVYDSRRNLKVGEYVMPPVSTDSSVVVLHSPKTRITPGDSLVIDATIVGANIDSVAIYPSSVDFWRSDNVTFPMNQINKYSFTAVIDLKGKKGLDRFCYNIVVFDGNGATTFPARESGTPLDWDYGAGRASMHGPMYCTKVATADAPVVLLDATTGEADVEFSSVPETWHGTGVKSVTAGLPGTGAAQLYRTAEAIPLDYIFITKYVGDVMADYADTDATTVCLSLGNVEGLDSLTIGLVTRDGFTYAGEVKVSSDCVARLSLDSLRLVPTLLSPAPFPSFIGRTFKPDATTAIPFKVTDVESVVIYRENTDQPLTVDIKGLWLD